jgi:hypothetical protein
MYSTSKFALEGVSEVLAALREQQLWNLCRSWTVAAEQIRSKLAATIKLSFTIHRAKVRILFCRWSGRYERTHMPMSRHKAATS